jgi:hypothetical protein
MTTKTPDESQTYLTGERADRWRLGKQRRDAAFGAVTEMMLEFVGFPSGRSRAGRSGWHG